MKIVILPPLFLPPAGYFSAMSCADLAVIDVAMRYDKRAKAVHRTVVEGLHGPLKLTVPVSTPRTSRCVWEEVCVSGHAEWYRTLRSTFDTLYDPTPFYEYMRDDILGCLTGRAVGRPITDVDVELIIALRRLGQINTPLSVTLDSRHPCPDDTVTDLRAHDWYADPGTRSAIISLFTTGSLLAEY